jgi:hypothetical protein
LATTVILTKDSFNDYNNSPHFYLGGEHSWVATDGRNNEFVSMSIYFILKEGVLTASVGRTTANSIDAKIATVVNEITMT